MASRAELDQAHARATVAIAALASPVRAVARRFQRKPGYVAYWKRKLTDPAFHPKPCGGEYNTKFDAAAQLAFEVTLWAEVENDPCRRLQDFALDMQQNYGFNVNRSFIKATFKRWRLTCKKVKRKHVLKFTMANIRYTLRYLVFIRGPLDWTRLKFCDEATFESKSLCRQWGYSEAGREVHQHIERKDYSAPTVSVTLFTDLNQPSGIAISDPRADSNTAIDFCICVLKMVQARVLVAGDILVLDNASTHTAAKVMPTLDPIFSRRGIRMIYLPAYSPEYNPCELVFAQVKRHMRQLRGNHNFTMELLHAFAAVERLNVFKYYKKCIEDAL